MRLLVDAAIWIDHLRRPDPALSRALERRMRRPRRLWRGPAGAADRVETRSIRNLADACDTIRDVLRASFGDDVAALRRFYG